MTIDWQLGSFGAGSPPPPGSARHTLAKKRVKSRQPIRLHIFFITLYLLSFSKHLPFSTHAYNLDGLFYMLIKIFVKGFRFKIDIISYFNSFRASGGRKRSRGRGRDRSTGQPGNHCLHRRHLGARFLREVSAVVTPPIPATVRGGSARLRV